MLILPCAVPTMLRSCYMHAEKVYPEVQNLDCVCVLWGYYSYRCFMINRRLRRAPTFRLMAVIVSNTVRGKIALKSLMTTPGGFNWRFHCIIELLRMSFDGGGGGGGFINLLSILLTQLYSDEFRWKCFSLNFTGPENHVRLYKWDSRKTKPPWNAIIYTFRNFKKKCKWTNWGQQCSFLLSTATLVHMVH